MDGSDRSSLFFSLPVGSACYEILKDADYHRQKGEAMEIIKMVMREFERFG